MNKLWLALGLFLGLVPAQVLGQNAGWPPPAGAQASLGVYNLTPPTLSAGNVGFMQVDSTGNLRVVNSAAPTGTQDINITEILGAAPSLTNPLWVVPATGATFAATQSGTWTVQPGNTANTTAWKVDGSAVTQPVSNAGTFAVQATLNAETTKVIGTVNQGTSPWVISGAVTNAGTFATQSAITAASGSIASGAQVDLLTMRGTVAAGTAAANSILAGAVYSSTAPTLTTGQQVAVQVSSRGGLLLGSGYPAAATPITASATGTTGATTATLATGATVTTYICGFSIRANATAAVTNNATVTGTITGTLNFTQWTAPAASGLGITEMIFTPCVPASAVNTSIAVVSGAPGTGGVVSSTAWGYTL